MLTTGRATPPGAFHLTFDDEFNSLSLWNGDTVWTGTTGTWKPYLPNNTVMPWALTYEAEIYASPTFPGFNGTTPLGLNPFSVNNGILTITAAAAPSADLSALVYPNDYLQPGSGSSYQYSYTSGMLTTQTKDGYGYTQTYGYFEMRAQLPTGAGLWPAFWLLPEDSPPFTTWQYEIDVLEAFGKQISAGGGANQVSEAFHVPSGVSGGFQTWQTIPGSIYSGYHTYGVNWQPDYVTYYVDGTQYAQVATPSGLNVPMLMLVNLAVGTSNSWPGAVDPTILPAQMNVDYVRVYSSSSSVAATTAQSGYDPNSGGIPILVAGSAPAVVNLSTRGQADWSHWGGTSSNNALVWDHAPGLATPLISNYTVVGSGTPVAYGGNESAFDWTSSAGPDATGSDAAGNGAGVEMSTTGAGFSFGVTTGIVPRIVNVYVGANHAGGQMQISNSSGTVLYNDSSIVDSTGGGANTIYTVDLPANGTYTFQWTKASGTGSVTLQGAAVNNGANTAGLAASFYTLAPSTLSAYRMDAYMSGGAGTKVDLNPPGSAQSETWVMTNLGGNLYEISPSYNTSLAITTSGTGSGSLLTLTAFTGATTQEWVATANVDGTFKLSPLNAPTQFLSVSKTGTTGTQFVTYASSSSYVQSWTFTTSSAPTSSVTPGTADTPTLPPWGIIVLGFGIVLVVLRSCAVKPRA